MALEIKTSLLLTIISFFVLIWECLQGQTRIIFLVSFIISFFFNKILL